ncbi:MAG: hypothetical protein IPN95_21790 [Bacteroidetes bacterium]|nr:hypothetical protein [Bacteroidota bacterium]
MKIKLDSIIVDPFDGVKALVNDAFVFQIEEGGSLWVILGRREEFTLPFKVSFSRRFLPSECTPFL